MVQNYAARCIISIAVTGLLANFLVASTTSGARTVPERLWGYWRITREIPTSTISCWGQNEVDAIIGTNIEYTQDSFRWRGFVEYQPLTEVTSVNRNKFEDANRASGSSVTFKELGLKARVVTRVVIQHAEAEIAGGTPQVPGDDILIKDRNTIVFSVCNVFFEAKRIEARPAASAQRR
jgi:hypothetical protein